MPNHHTRFVLLGSLAALVPLYAALAIAGPIRVSISVAREAQPAAADPTRPLAERLRPETLEEYTGQEHILGPGKPLRTLVEAARAAGVEGLDEDGDVPRDRCGGVPVQADTDPVLIGVGKEHVNDTEDLETVGKLRPGCSSPACFSQGVSGIQRRVADGHVQPGRLDLQIALLECAWKDHHGT
mgnify:CR=1 FL=1